MKINEEKRKEDAKMAGDGRGTRLGSKRGERT